MDHQIHQRMLIHQPAPLHGQHIENGDCLSEVANAFMTGKYGHHWSERGIKIGFSDWCFIALIILFTAAIFLVGFLFAFVLDILRFSFGKDGLFREITFPLRSLDDQLPA